MTATEIKAINEGIIGIIDGYIIARPDLADPKDFAQLVIEDLDDEQLQRFALHGVRDYIATRISVMRRRVVENPSQSGHAASYRGFVVGIMERPYSTGGGWKRLSEMTLADCRYVQYDRAQRAETEHAEAKKFERLAIEFGSKSAGKTVADLNPRKVEAIFS